MTNCYKTKAAFRLTNEHSKHLWQLHTVSSPQRESEQQSPNNGTVIITAIHTAITPEVLIISIFQALSWALWTIQLQPQVLRASFERYRQYSYSPHDGAV